MKMTIKLFAAAFIALLTCSCYDEYKSDFDYTSTYFAMQKPFVKLVESSPNSSETLDLEAGVVLAGVYSNDRSWKVGYEIDQSLFTTNAANQGFELLPADYYTVTNANEFVIPAEDVVGRVTFKINREKFMNDQKALDGKYALPLKIVSSETDSILTAKNYAIIKLTYLNKYHGNYWITGSDAKVGGETVTYKEADNEFNLNRRLNLVTKSENTLMVPYVGEYTSTGNSMLFTFSEDGKSVTVGPMVGSKIQTISGTGSVSYEKTEYDMENVTGYVINVKYTYTDAQGSVHNVEDKLQFSKISNNDNRVLEWGE